MRPLKVARVLGIVVIVYLTFPMVAGLCAIGDRDGPKIYSMEYHSFLYMVGYESVREEKPRINPNLERPWFYGFPRRSR